LDGKVTIAVFVDGVGIEIQGVPDRFDVAGTASCVDIG
jgi:hypothetical protein